MNSKTYVSMTDKALSDYADESELKKQALEICQKLVLDIQKLT